MRQTAVNERSGWRGLALAIAGAFTFLPIWLPLVSVLFFSPLPSPSPRNLPHSSRPHSYRYWNHQSMYPERYTDNSSTKSPVISELQHAASSWQLLKVGKENVYVYGAYYDDRFEERMVRILIYTDVHPLPELFCKLWFPDHDESQTELAEAMYAWHPGWGGHFNGVNEPYVLSCRCRRKDLAPITAAVVTAPCDVATNAMKVQNPFEDPLDYIKDVPSFYDSTFVAISLRWLNYRDDVSAQVVEWMQLVKRLGAEKVYIYVIGLHPNTSKALKYYEDEGFAVVTELSQPPEVTLLKLGRLARVFRGSRIEMLPLPDCLYRSIGRHDWLETIDLDEIIAPALGQPWVDLFDNTTALAAVELGGLLFDGLEFLNSYALDATQKNLEAPANTRIFSRNGKSKSRSPFGWSIKPFVNVCSVTAKHTVQSLSFVL